MPLSIRNMIAIVVTAVILLSVVFAVALYYPTSKRAKRMAKSRAILEAQVETFSPSAEQAGSRAPIIDATAMDINFFKKRNLVAEKGIPELLEQINRMGSQMKIQFVAVKPLDEEEAPEYRRYPFLIEAVAGYPELVSFVERIEEGLHLSLNDLKIEAEKKTPSVHRLQFTLNIVELREDLEATEAGPTVDQIPSPMEMDLVRVDRDPFSLPKGPEAVQVAEKPKKAKVAPKKPNRPKLVLMGIMEIAGSKRAIINNQVLKQGEVIRGQRINEIADDHVVIWAGNKTYSIYLKGSSGPGE
jgi:Tfp pilus assembly protein PilO